MAAFRLGCHNKPKRVRGHDARTSALAPLGLNELPRRRAAALACSSVLQSNVVLRANHHPLHTSSFAADKRRPPVARSFREGPSTEAPLAPLLSR
jgi:hypothetical protein